MSETQATSGYVADEPYIATRSRSAEPTAWAGFVIFAAVMLMLMGSFQIMQGIVAIIRDDYFLTTRNGLVLTIDYTAWGWTHVVIGLIAIAVGLGIFAGQMWARVVGIAIACLSALANAAFLPAYPLWCAIIIAFDVLIIYALAVHGREVK